MWFLFNMWNCVLECVQEGNDSQPGEYVALQLSLIKRWLLQKRSLQKGAESHLTFGY